MNANISPRRHLLIEYDRDDCARYNRSRRGYWNPVTEAPGILLFDSDGVLKYPRRLTEPEWFFADWLRDRALDGDRRASESARTA